MKRLPSSVKSFIVQALACYDSPTEVAAAVKREFGIEISRQQVHAYDATRAGKKPAKRWCELFARTRADHLKERDTVPTANRATRLRRLHRMAMNAEAKNNIPLAKDLLEQIAKELGGKYTNRKIIELADQDRAHFEWVEQIANMLDTTPADLIARLLKITEANPFLAELAWITMLAKMVDMTPIEAGLAISNGVDPLVAEFEAATRLRQQLGNEEFERRLAFLQSEAPVKPTDAIRALLGHGKTFPQC